MCCVSCKTPPSSSSSSSASVSQAARYRVFHHRFDGQRTPHRRRFGAERTSGIVLRRTASSGATRRPHLGPAKIRNIHCILRGKLRRVNPPPRQDGDHYNNNNDRGRGDAAQEEEELRVAVQARLVQSSTLSRKRPSRSGRPRAILLNRSTRFYAP